MVRSLFLGFCLAGAMVVSAQSTPPAAVTSNVKLTPEVKSQLITMINDRVTRLAFVPGKDFSSFPKSLEKFQARIDGASTTTEFASVINSALAEFGVSHMNVITPEAANARRTGGTVGLGIQLEIVPDGIRLLAVFPNSPASKAGLKPGDVITAVNGTKPTSRSALDGTVGTQFTLTVRGEDGKTRETKVTRAFFSTREPESVRWLDPTTALLRIPTFDGLPPRPGQQPTGYDSANVRNLMDDVNAKAKSLIIDLRNNPGGVVLNMQAFAGYFIPRDKPMGAFVNRFTSRRFVEETKSKPDDLKAFLAWTTDKVRANPQRNVFSGRIAVLINGGTGSAAEMVSAGLRDTVGARIFGQKSIGMVLASVITPLDPMNATAETRTGFQMIVPIQDYITINGLRIEGTGVVPDTVVSNAAVAGKDPVVEAAQAWLAAAPTPR